MAITLAMLLGNCGLVPDVKRTKLVRHSGPRVESLPERWLETYQQYQSAPVFDGCEQIIAFVGEGSSGSRFMGVYDVPGKTPAEQVPLPTGCPPEVKSANGFHYNLVKRSGFEELENRLIVDWGGAALALHQWFTDRPVLEIRRLGRLLPQFQDYLKVHLSHPDLVQLIEQPKAHPDWYAALSAVGAVYLVVDTSDAGRGQQYIGSATGTQGLWQRWTDYANAGHAGNKLLIEVCKQRPHDCPKNFWFSILDTFSRNLSRNAARAIESRFKEKLGTRAFGLNDN